MQTMEFAGMDALLWVSMLIGMYIAYVLVVKLKYKEVQCKKGDVKFSYEYLYTFLAISTVFVGLLVSVVSWINGLEMGVDIFVEASVGNCAIVGALAGVFVLIFQDQVRVKVDMYLKEKKNILCVATDLKDEIDAIETKQKRGL